jgi:hypothetical protein
VVFIQVIVPHGKISRCDLACHLRSLGSLRPIFKMLLIHMIFIMGVNNISMSREDTEIHGALSDVT